jgi:hypothetical protein
MQNVLFSNDAKQPQYNSFDSSGVWYFQWSVRPVISSFEISALEIENAY